jgi:Transposase DDE domain group 1
MENRIKECRLDLFADRTPVQARGRLSAKTMRANQLRLWFASMAYVLLCALRPIALQHTPFAVATCGTIRLKLLKIGALVRVSVRRIKIAMAPGCAHQNEFALAHAGLTNRPRSRRQHRPCVQFCRGEADRLLENVRIYEIRADAVSTGMRRCRTSLPCAALLARPCTLLTLSELSFTVRKVFQLRSTHAP